MPCLETSVQWPVFRVGTEDATFLEPKFKPQFTAQDITKLDNYNAYVNMLVNGQLDQTV